MATIECALTAAGVSVVTATTDHGLNISGTRIENIDAGGVSITRFYGRKRTDFYKVAPALIPWFWRNARGFDVIHIHALFSFSSVVAALIARTHGVPYIIRPLGTLTAYSMTRRARLKRASFSLLEAPLLQHAAAVHFTSEEERDEARALQIPMYGEVIPLGVEEGGTGNAERLEGKYPGLASGLAVLYLSRLDPKKNVEALLEAFAAISKRHEKSMLLIAGSGALDYTAHLKCHADGLGIADRIVWLGHVDGQQKQDVFARAGVFVLPSFSENFGIAAVEAMLAGLPCILGEGVAVSKKAAAEGAAFAVAPVGDCISTALDRLLSDENLRKAMGAKARAHARQHYSTEVMTAALIELYKKVSKSSPVELA